jgi:ATP synthase F0 subunit c
MEFSVELIRIAAYVGAGLSVSIASVASGIGVGYIAGDANTAIMKQPESYDQVFRTMFIGQAVTGSSGVFALVVSLLLLYGGLDVAEGGWFRFSALLSSGIAMGLGAVGPSFGAGYVGGKACLATGRMPKKSYLILSNMLIGQALAQTAAIFALVVSLLLLYSTPLQSQFTGLTAGAIIVRSVAYLGAGIAIGFGTIGPGIGNGNVVGKACEMLGKYPAQHSKIIRTMFLGAAVSQSTAIYSLVIALLLIFAIQ